MGQDTVDSALTTVLRVRVSPAQHKLVEIAARSDGTNLSRFLRRALLEAVRQRLIDVTTEPAGDE